MSRKLWSLIAGLTAALTITGVAWASLPGVSASSREDAKIAASSSKVSLAEQADVSTSLDDASSTTVESTATTLESGTSTTVEQEHHTSTTDGPTSTTMEQEQEHHTTTTIVDGTASTTPHEDEHSSSDDHESTTTTAGSPQSLLNVVQTFQADGAGSVTVQVVAGVMTITSVDPTAGWDARVGDASSHEVEVEFRNGDQDVTLSIEIDGTLKAHVEHS